MKTESHEINVEFITPQGDQKKLISRSVEVKTSNGRIEILRNHAPFFALLEPGTIKINPVDKKKKAEQIYLKGSGVIEVFRNQIVILADNGFFGEQLDQEALVKSESELRKKINTNPELLAETLKQLKEVKEKLKITEEIRDSANRGQ